MSFSLRLCVIVLTVYSTREDALRLGDQHQHIYNGNFTDYSVRKIGKRWITAIRRIRETILSLFKVKDFRLKSRVNVVLDHARVSKQKKPSAKRKFRIRKKQVVQLEKNGGFEEAVRDFYLLRPKDVKTIRERNGVKKGVSKLVISRSDFHPQSC